jgi:geranylgeranyl reductase family protein
VGAGPAGSAAAIAALRAWPGARVALLDRAAFPRDKPCGDGVAPHVLDVLARLGVHGLLDDLVPVSRLRMGFPGGAGADRVMARPAYVVPREVLDARLAGAAVGLGAELVRRRVRSVQPGAGARGGVAVRAQDGDLTADVVIGADGPHSVVRSALTPGATGRRAPGRRAARRRTVAVALRGYAPAGADRRHEQVIVFDPGAAWPAYAWSFPIGDGRANVGYGELLDRDGHGPAKARMLQRLEELLPGATEGGTAWRGHHLPLSTGRFRQPDGPVLLAGDALALVNPLTGEGIRAAVLSGALAGLAASRAARRGRPDAAGRAHRLALRAGFGRHHAQVGALARLPLQRQVVAAGLRAAATDQRVFDDVVELGLAEGGLTPGMVAGALRHLR